MRSFAKTAFCALYKYSGAVLVQETLARLRSQASLAVLLLHRVTDDIPEDGLTVTTRWFDQLCRMLKRHFQVVPLAEIVRLVQSGGNWPRRTVAITFDDCYRSNLFAARLLAEHGLAGCFFLPTAFVGTEHVFAWDRQLGRQLPNLSWDEVREMVQLGHEIGSHTHTHADMASLTVEQARRELRESRQVLEHQLGQAGRWFAYPFGREENFKPEYLELVKEAGFEACFSGHGGVIRPGLTCGQVLPREPIPYFRSMLNLELHLRGSLDWVYACKRRLHLP